MPAFIDTWLHTDSKHITIYPPLSGHNNIQRNGSKHAQHQHQPLDLMEHRRMKTLQLFSLLSIKDHGPTLIKQILWINKNSLRGWWSKTDLNNGIFTINQKANRMFISFSLKIVSSCSYPLLMLIYIHHSIDWTNIEANISRGIKIPGDFSDSWEIKFVFTWSKTFNLQTF